MDRHKGSSDSQAEVLTRSGRLVGKTAEPRGILLQETLYTVAEGNSGGQDSSEIDQRLTSAPRTDRQRSLGIRGTAPCRFAFCLWLKHHQSPDYGCKDLPGSFCSLVEPSRIPLRVPWYPPSSLRSTHPVLGRSRQCFLFPYILRPRIESVMISLT